MASAAPDPTGQIEFLLSAADLGRAPQRRRTALVRELEAGKSGVRLDKTLQSLPLRGSPRSSCRSSW